MSFTSFCQGCFHLEMTICYSICLLISYSLILKISLLLRQVGDHLVDRLHLFIHLTVAFLECVNHLPLRILQLLLLFFLIFKCLIPLILHALSLSITFFLQSFVLVRHFSVFLVMLEVLGGSLLILLETEDIDWGAIAVNIYCVHHSCCQQLKC